MVGPLEYRFNERLINAYVYLKSLIAFSHGAIGGYQLRVEPEGDWLARQRINGKYFYYVWKTAKS